ncbi:MAG: YihA family ribosome biogenesis GTP-binding protein [Azospirillum sp.]|nr:YihA family ribosome biogenesis GTP-binding protein [Azospirillum sp.]
MPDLDAAAIEAGRLLFAAECRFLWGVAELSQLPEAGLDEIAFAGRSNVGKSSLVNALTGRRTLARTSGTPGCTRQLNFFDLGERLVLVDLPGYGYAQESKERISAWTALVNAYLKGRATLRRVCLLIDARHGLKPVDDGVLTLLDGAAVACQVVLTKADKVSPSDLERRRRDTTSALARHPAAHPEVAATSAHDGSGIAELRAGLATLART